MVDEFIGKKIKGPNDELFEIVNFLGNGSFGKVYQTVGAKSGMTAAVKTALNDKYSNASTDGLRALINEMKHALIGINHPNVVSYLHVDEEGDNEVGPYILMEYVNSGNLLELLRRLRTGMESLELKETISLMRGIALGAEAINEKLIHRDIKPDNIMLSGKSNDYIPKIADLGLSKIAIDPTRAETFKGVQAIAYMAPEVWNRLKNTQKIDVYSVGLVFYEILLLAHPYIGKMHDPTDFLEWRDAHLSMLCPDIRQSRSDISPEISRLLQRMTDKQPANRPDWEEVLKILHFTPPEKTSVKVDPSLIQALKNQADEIFRAKQSQTEAELKAAAKQKLQQLRMEEYNETYYRLIIKFDEIIEALNSEIPDIEIIISGDPSHRQYKLPNGKSVTCRNFGYAPHGNRNVLGGGYMGVSGGLSANLVLMGSHDDISQGSWNAITVTTPLYTGSKKLDLYKRANIDNITIEYLEDYGYKLPWSRDLPRFFGINESTLFFQKAGIGAMDVYQLEMKDIFETFNDILKVALKIPAKY